MTGERQQGMTLIEVLLAVALTALLGVMLSTSLQLWLSAGDRLQREAPTPSQVLAMCDGLERRFDGLVLRELHEHGLLLPSRPLQWQPSEQRLDWVALDGLPLAATLQASRVRRMSLLWNADAQRLELNSSDDLDALGAAHWRPSLRLDGVERLTFSFYDGQRWLAYPGGVDGENVTGVRLALQLRGEPYVCTFVLPDTV